MRASVPVLIAPFLALCSSPALPDPAHEHPAGDPELLGSVEFQMSCVPEAREQLARATAILHSFRERHLVTAEQELRAATQSRRVADAGVREPAGAS